MIIIFIFLCSAILLKFFTPKEPNLLFGYQLGSAKKSLEHWKMANKYAANYWIFLNILTLAILVIHNYYKDYSLDIVALIVFLLGNILTFLVIEKKLKAI